MLAIHHKPGLTVSVDPGTESECRQPPSISANPLTRASGIMLYVVQLFDDCSTTTGPFASAKAVQVPTELENCLPVSRLS